MIAHCQLPPNATQLRFVVLSVYSIPALAFIVPQLIDTFSGFYLILSSGTGYAQQKYGASCLAPMHTSPLALS
jgi:hypothetical protein